MSNESKADKKALRITKAFLDSYINGEGLSWDRFAPYIRPKVGRFGAFDMATRHTPIREVDQERFRAAMLRRAKDNIQRGEAMLKRIT